LMAVKRTRVTGDEDADLKITADAQNDCHWQTQPSMQLST